MRERWAAQILKKGTVALALSHLLVQNNKNNIISLKNVLYMCSHISDIIE